MVHILQPASIWQQLANLSFLLSAFFGDILLIRICLIMAYVWLMVNACVGFPSWPHINDGPAGEPGYISVDGITWAAVNLFFHTTALVQLLWDERKIRFKTEDEEQCWRFFNRRSGMGRLEFLESWKRARTARFAAGQEILSAKDSVHRLMLLVEGAAAYTALDGKGQVVGKDVPLLSGQTFDIGLLNVLGVYIGFEKGHHFQTTVTAKSDCLVVFWELEALNQFATVLSPALSGHWRNFALCQIGLEWFTRQNPGSPPINARGKAEPAGILDGTCRSSDFSDPLEAYEDPRPSLMGVLRWLPTTLAPFLPPGMRHNSMPHTGAMARNRLMALARAVPLPQRSVDRVLASEPLSTRHNSRMLLAALTAAHDVELEEVGEEGTAAAEAQRAALV